MAQRTWLVRPDHEVMGVAEDGSDIAIPVVSRNALIQAALDGVAMVDRAGGCFTMIGARVKTGVPNERVTGGAMCEWKDRVDARPQPEQDAGPLVPAPSANEPVEPQDA